MNPPLRLRERLRFWMRRAKTVRRVAVMVARTQGLRQLARVVGRGLARLAEDPPEPIEPSFASRDHRLQRKVAVIIPTYDQTTLVSDCVASVFASLLPENRALVRVIVVDDGSPPGVQAWLRRLPVDLIEKPSNEGYARAVNDGIAAASADEDVLALNNDILAHPRCIEALQQRAYANPKAGVVGAKLVYPDGRIQFAGTYRSLASPQWFDHCYRWAASDHAPASVEREVLAVTGACMYIKRAVIDRIGPFDADFPMAFEDVDYCLRAREAGFEILYAPQTTLTHLEGHTRGERREARELVSQDRFWRKWGEHFDGRRVWRESPERLSIIYVLQDTGVTGGHRVGFEHMNRLAALGHEVELYSLATKPKWFPLRVPVKTFPDYEALLRDLAGREAIKVATWWETSDCVWRASLGRGVPVYLVQDIEATYYGDQHPQTRASVLASYRKEFHYVADATWTRQQLRSLGVEAQVVSPGVDHDVFRPLERERRDDIVLSIGRASPLKNLELTLRGVAPLRDRAELWLFGIEPDVGKSVATRYAFAPTDAEVANLYNQATVFVSTSDHEGFGLPMLEAMACGCPVICTDADGNMDFCRDGENCLIVPKHRPEALTATIERLLRDGDLQGHLRHGGLETARAFSWESAISKLGGFYGRIASERSGRLRAPVRPPASLHEPVGRDG